MKKLFLLLFALNIINVGCAQTNDTLFVAHWNVENLFDIEDDPLTDDAEWVLNGPKEWNQERLEKKMYNLSRVISSMNENNGPDILGVCEVEHQSLLDTMIAKFLSDKNYKIGYLESPDGRGIDNGVIYNSKKYNLLNVKGYNVDLGNDEKTRLILLTTFLTLQKDTLHFFVNHWPSRRGGENESEYRRVAAAKTLRKVVDSLFTINPDSKIIIVGDFNDEPGNISFTDYLKAKPFVCDNFDTKKLPEDSGTDLFNTAYKGWSEGFGSFKYQDKFNMLDQIIISRDLLIGKDIMYLCNSFEVYKPEMMVTRTGKFQGAPFPTYGGSRYLGGYSDHFPVTAKFILFKK